MRLPEQKEDLSIPQKLEKDISHAIEYLLNVLRVERIGARTHEAIVVSGWNDNAECRRAIAVYLVGLCESAIDTALKIRADLLDDDNESGNEIYEDVCGIVAENNASLTEDQKQDERNPWIAEGLWHLCMVIANRKTEIHPIGNVVSVGPVHVRAKDHGLDGLAIYEVDEDNLGLSIIESKAYKSDPNQAISKAVAFFKQIDENKHSSRIRHSVNLMRSGLSPELQSKVSGSFWKRIRTYIPNPHYDITHTADWSNSRPSFRKLNVTKDNIIVMPHTITNFDEFFDQLAEEMREYARGFTEDV